jgi:rare lipoprotein A
MAAAVALQSLTLPLLAGPVAGPPTKTAATPDHTSTPVPGRTQFAPNPDNQLAAFKTSNSQSSGFQLAPIKVQLVAAKPRNIKQVAARLSGQVASRLSGIASWYGRALHGHTTASGEIFDETALTACHRTLPFGTIVKVENMRNHQTVVVRITDRGVLNPERVIDLSSAAAEKIGMLRDGIAPVRLSIVQQ